jgi:hypothetical protein
MLNPIQLGRLRQGFAALGPDGASLFAEALGTMRVALAHALNDVFLVGAVVMLAAIIANLFLPEIPLRRTIRMAGESASETAPSATVAAGGD